MPLLEKLLSIFVLTFRYMCTYMEKSLNLIQIVLVVFGSKSAP